VPTKAVTIPTTFNLKVTHRESVTIPTSPSTFQQQQ